MLSFVPIVLDVTHGDEHAMLVYRREKLMAVITRLGAAHGAIAGHWFIETLFASDATALNATYSDLSEVEMVLLGTDQAPGSN